MPRSKELQKLFNVLGEVEYNKLIKINQSLSKKKWRDNNKDYKQTPAGIKSKTLSNWKTYGITFGDMTDSEFYDNIYLPATNCQSCNKIFNKINKNDWKQADHKHEPLNLCNIRGVICNQCNSHDNWKKRLTPDSIYNQYLTIPSLPDTLTNTNKNISVKA